MLINLRCKIYVFGEVETPGVQVLTDKPVTILDALGQAGGVKDEADLINATLTRADQQYAIDLLALYEEGDVEQNQRLQDGGDPPGLLLNLIGGGEDVRVFGFQF